jgi:hypothetical protein
MINALNSNDFIVVELELLELQASLEPLYLLNEVVSEIQQLPSYQTSF